MMPNTRKRPTPRQRKQVTDPLKGPLAEKQNQIENLEGENASLTSRVAALEGQVQALLAFRGRSAGFAKADLSFSDISGQIHGERVADNTLPSAAVAGLDGAKVFDNTLPSSALLSVAGAKVNINSIGRAQINLPDLAQWSDPRYVAK